MWLLGQQFGKTWWQKRDGQDNWVPVTEEENEVNKKYWNYKFEEICAKVFNDAFNRPLTDEERHQIDKSNQHQERDE